MKLDVIDINEMIAIMVGVFIGSIGFICATLYTKSKPVNVAFILSVTGINIFVTYTASGIIKALNYGGYRAIILPLIAFLGAYIIEWFVDNRQAILNGVGSRLLAIINIIGINFKKNNDETKD